MSGVLWLDTQNSRARWDGAEIRLKPIRWIGFLVLLARRFGKGHISADEVAELEGFRGHLSPENVGKKIRHYVESSLNLQVGCELVVCKPGKSELLFQLNPEIVKEIQWVSANDVLMDALPFQSTPPQESLEDLAALSNIEALLESGNLRQAEEALRPLIGSAFPATLVRVLLAQSNIHLLKSDLKEASIALARAQDSSAASLDVRLGQLIQLQMARLEYMAGNYNGARTLVQKLFHLVSHKDFAFRARLEMLLGLLEMSSAQEPKTAKVFFHSALYNALEAKWWWGVQAVYANLGLMWVRQAQHPTVSLNENIRLGHLEMARTWFERARRFGQETGLSQGSPELMVWTARVRRELGEVDRIGPLLDDAQALAKILGSIRGEAEVLLEMGEVAWFLGRKQEARAHWQVAMELGLPSLERTELYTRVQERLELV